MKSLQLSLVILISLALAPTSTPIYARPGCTDMCGKIRIPYPFGIGTGCYINEWYAVDCNSSTPYLSAINNLELLSLNLENQTMAVNFSMNSDCVDTIRNNSQILSVDLGESPFLFSREDNKFTVEGCGMPLSWIKGETWSQGVRRYAKTKLPTRETIVMGSIVAKPRFLTILKHTPSILQAYKGRVQVEFVGLPSWWMNKCICLAGFLGNLPFLRTPLFQFHFDGL